MAFVGREAEQATFVERLDVVRGEGSVVCVHGELGIGKTWFVQRCAELATERGYTVARGTWYESSLVPAYVGFQECLAELLKAQQRLLHGGLDLDDPRIRNLATLGPEIALRLSSRRLSPSASC